LWLEKGGPTNPSSEAKHKRPSVLADTGFWNGHKNRSDKDSEENCQSLGHKVSYCERWGGGSYSGMGGPPPRELKSSPIFETRTQKSARGAGLGLKKNKKNRTTKMKPVGGGGFGVKKKKKKKCNKRGRRGREGVFPLPRNVDLAWATEGKEIPASSQGKGVAKGKGLCRLPGLWSGLC